MIILYCYHIRVDVGDGLHFWGHHHQSLKLWNLNLHYSCFDHYVIITGNDAMCPYIIIHWRHTVVWEKQYIIIKLLKASQNSSLLLLYNILQWTYYSACVWCGNCLWLWDQVINRIMWSMELYDNGIMWSMGSYDDRIVWSMGRGII